jgi:hypothetical protein
MNSVSISIYIKVFDVTDVMEFSLIMDGGKKILSRLLNSHILWDVESTMSIWELTFLGEELLEVFSKRKFNPSSTHFDPVLFFRLRWWIQHT